MRAGPKPAVDGSPLPLRGSRRRGLAVARFASDYIRVPRGQGVRKPLRLRPGQRALIAATWDARPQPRLAGWMLPRGQGETSRTAVLALYELLAGAEGAGVVAVATDEREAALVHRQAGRMVELHPELEGRVQQYADALAVPARGSSFQALPAVPKRLEGLDFTWTVPTAGSWRIPPSVTSRPRRVAGCVAAEGAGSVVPAGPVLPAHRPARGRLVAPVLVGRVRRRDQEYPDGAEVVVAFDGSFNGDTTCLVVATVDQRPHIDLVELWEPAGAQVPIVDVEAAIRAACRRWRVLEIAADPYRWARSLQLLDQEGLPVLEHPQSPGRMTPATARFYEAVINGQLTHSGDSRLARHIGNAVLREDARGARLAKEHRDSKRRIDAAVAAVMAHDRAAALAGVTRDSIDI